MIVAAPAIVVMSMNLFSSTGHIAVSIGASPAAVVYVKVIAATTTGEAVVIGAAFMAAGVNKDSNTRYIINTDLNLY